MKCPSWEIMLASAVATQMRNCRHKLRGQGCDSLANGCGARDEGCQLRAAYLDVPEGIRKNIERNITV
jgi:hypothetical protein